MIYIQNISSKETPEEGINKYEIRINKKVVCKFEHGRKAGGLAQCLRDAAKAVDEKRFKDVLNHDFLKGIK